MIFGAGFSLINIYVYFTLFSNQVEFTDVAIFGGDTWEYQSMAVNFSKAHGIQRFGGLEGFDTYKFDHYDSSLAKDFFAEAGRFNTYRTPLYPLFLGTIYKIFGISPAIVKKIQLLLLIIIASLLPWIGNYYWDTKGLISGIIAGFIYLVGYYFSAHQILTEAFFSFLILLVVIATILYEKYKNPLSAAGLGLATGLAILTKGNLLFIPILLFLYLLLSYLKNREKFILKSTAAFMIMFALTVSPWSLYASIHSRSLIILSSQAENVLLDCNNENCTDGDWHPEWRNNPSANLFYNMDQMEGRSPVLRVVNFYFHNMDILPTIIINKILKGFEPFLFFYLSVIFIILHITADFFKSRSVNSVLLTPFFIPVIVISLLIVIANYFNFFTKPLVNHFELFTKFEIGTFVKIGAIVVFLFLLTRKRAAYHAPFIFIALFLNFFLMTIISFGEPRYIGVMDFMFMLWGIYSALSFIDRLISGIKKSDPSLSSS